MNEAAQPTIKGLFVKSHVRALARLRGPEGLVELLRRTGKSHRYETTEDVPVSEEVELLECIVDMVSSVQLTDEQRQDEAGRLHMRNFATTTMWTLLEQLIGRNLKFLFSQSAWIGAWVFHGIQFKSEDIDHHVVRISMINSVYPLAHFRGFFSEWLKQLDVEGAVEAAELEPGHHTFTISWK